MATTYITDASLLDKVAVRFGTTAQQLVQNSPQWEDIVADANQDAYHEIRRVLVGRGYTTSIIDTWDERAAFNRKIALCHALTEGGIQQEDAGEALDRVCKCREELLEVVILVNGVEQEPSASSGIGFGDMERDDDVFTDDSWDAK